MRKKLVALGICLLLAISAMSCGIGKSSESSETKLKNNQKYVYVSVTSIVGNEMTYTKLTTAQIKMIKAATNKSSNTSKNKTQKNSSSSNSQKSGSSGAANQQMPQGGPGQEQSNANSKASSDTKNTKTQSSTEMMTPPSSGEDSTQSMPTEEGTESASETNEKKVTVQIPVSVDVHTKADTTTTFSRIESGDILKMLVQTDDNQNEVILEIWMQS